MYIADKQVIMYCCRVIINWYLLCC